MSPELFDTYSQMRNRELRRTAARARMAAGAGGARRDLLTAVRSWLAWGRSWLAARLRGTPRRTEPCPTC